MEFTSERPLTVDTNSEKFATNDEQVPRPLHDADSVRTVEPIDPQLEKRALRKCDLRVLPFLSILYLFAFLDRVNIGNARIQGLEKDLNMSGHDYNIALQVFFIPYLIFEIPSNIAMRKVAPSTWISGIMLGWGIITVCQGVTQSFAGLVVCRLLLGLFEAGFYPGCLYLISMYYKRHELQRRFNWFFTMGVLSGAVSGLLAYALAKMDGIGGYSGRRWIFIIEGLATIVLAIIGYFIFADWPETAKFLTPEERAMIVRRAREDIAGATMNRLDAKSRRRMFLDWKIWCGTIAYFGSAENGYSGFFFTPTILKQLGWTAVKAQLYSIPPYALSALAVVLIATASDRLRHRYTFILLGIAITTIGYSILLAQHHVAIAVRYLAIYLWTIGGFIYQPLLLVWLQNNLGGHYKRGIGAAMQIGLGNLGGILASNVYIAGQAPTFHVGFGTSVACQWLTGVASTVFFVGLVRENRTRERGGRDYRYNLPQAEQENLGDEHPSFRFVY
ncbi:MAG: hypothetical protein Q9182_006344 [Xanthomendoza sp. 2 TL-2023]